MSGAIYAAAAGAINSNKQMAVIANNLSNINTVGFKGDRASFLENYSRVSSMKNPEDGSDTKWKPRPENLSYLPFMTKTDFTPGRIKGTGNPVDVAIEGNGFFCVKTSGGIQYTRKGNFTINDEQYLVTQDGLQVLGKGGKIKIDGGEIVIDTQGNISVDGKQIDTFKIVDFPQPYPLTKTGDTLFAISDSEISPRKIEQISIIQGCVELSNVDAVRMMTEMIEALRGVESYQKIIQQINDVTSKTINDVGRVA